LAIISLYRFVVVARRYNDRTIFIESRFVLLLSFYHGVAEERHSEMA